MLLQIGLGSHFLIESSSGAGLGVALKNCILYLYTNISLNKIKISPSKNSVSFILSGRDSGSDSVGRVHNYAFSSPSPKLETYLTNGLWNFYFTFPFFV